MSPLLKDIAEAEAPDRGLDWRIHNRLQLIRGECPRYTSSFDAALLLVPEGYDWIVGDVNGYVGGTPYACVGSEKAYYGCTAVLSLCLAALAAEQEMLAGVDNAASS